MHGKAYLFFENLALKKAKIIRRGTSLSPMQKKGKKFICRKQLILIRRFSTSFEL
jgi:hypothetical protein